MDPAIAKELAALRQEIESLRAESAGARPADAAPRSAAEGDEHGEPGAWIDQLKELIATIEGAVESAENSVVVHPIAGVAAAFAAGLLIGRLTKQG
ncbi:MAG: hypothetical protein ABSC25_25090 [Roseiarcus sp.]|jgi:ElaB/YqjD/DUF883 family membrane-anchored ribosome-binding protein